VKHTFVWATWEFCSESGADAHQDSRVTTQTRGIFHTSSESHCCWAFVRCSLWSVDCCSRDDRWSAADGDNGMSDPVSVKNAARLTVILAVCLRTAYVPLD